MVMKKKLPVGISDFRKVIERDYYFIDKSLFIKDILNDDSETVLLPRPRRFGKTLNMTMLRTFVEKTEEDNSVLFKDLKITKENEWEKQGQYPVIYLTFKDIKEKNWDKCFQKLCALIKDEYQKHNYLQKSNDLEKLDKKYIDKIINGDCDEVDLSESLKNLSKFLHFHHKVKPFILIDEYDTPINKGYDSDYYEKVVSFLRNFLSGGLKDNVHLEKGVLTGIYRVAKESIFSGLNNLGVYSILDDSYSDYFGLLQKEVDVIIQEYKLEDKTDDIQSWYNGYNFGGKIIYNPWSIINFVSRKGVLKAYWIQTSENAIIRKLILSESIKKKSLIDLISGNGIIKTLDEHISFKDLDESKESFWSFLTFSGYLKVELFKLGKRPEYKLTIPNMEVEIFFEEILLLWLNETVGSEKLDYMLESLVTGNIRVFEKLLNEFVLSVLSYYDTDKDEPEKVYHAFFLGLFLNLSDKYEIKSNRESGYGRYDCVLIPKEITGKGFVIEIKKVDRLIEEEDFDKAINSALNQIKEKKYDQVLRDRGIKDIAHMGIAVENKKVKMKAVQITS